MRQRLHELWLWASLPGSTPAIRDFVGVFALLQGVVRIIDDRLFEMPGTVLLTMRTYGIVQVLVAIWLLSTRWSGLRGCGAGRMAAAMMAGVFAMLAADLIGRNAASGIPALLFVWVLAIESRYVLADSYH